MKNYVGIRGAFLDGLAVDNAVPGTPIVTLESQTPVNDFDVFAFSVSFEWDYTNVLTLLRLAGSAPSLRRLSVTTTVGIADADILEARIMSLLRKPELKTRWKKLLLFVVSLLLLVPSVAATAFAFRDKRKAPTVMLNGEPPSCFNCCFVNTPLSAPM